MSVIKTTCAGENATKAQEHPGSNETEEERQAVAGTG